MEDILEDIPASTSSTTDYVLDTAENLVSQCKRMVSSADEFLKPKEKWEAGKQFSKEHPAAAFFVIILVAMSIIPIACFCAFAVCTTLAVLTSCLFFEGNCFTLVLYAVVKSHY